MNYKYFHKAYLLTCMIICAYLVVNHIFKVLKQSAITRMVIAPQLYLLTSDDMRQSTQQSY